VLRACLEAPDVSRVRAIVRKPLVLEHPKLEQIVHRDFEDYTAAASALEGVDACFYCLGISTTQASSEAEYRKITYDYAVAAARALEASSPSAPFQLVSGNGTSERSFFMWARVKAETEKAIREISNGNAFRPAAIDGQGAASQKGWSSALVPVFLAIARPFRGLYIRAVDLGNAMLQVTREGLRGRTFENREIRDLAERAAAAP
jgi:uncharacterized protein YbjT (DUF2867 family)